MTSHFDERRRALLVLNCLPLMGPVTLRGLLAHFDNDPCAIFGASRPQLMEAPRVGGAVADCILGWKRHVDPDRELRQMERHGARFLIVEDPDYPEWLRHIHDPPIGLYAMGPGRLATPCVAIVGTRSPTQYGRAVARKLARELADAGIPVVSGLASGIDAEAHRATLDAGGTTAAVLGNGIDIVYPAENADLRDDIAARGLLLSEFRFGKRSDKQTFPMRNRIVAGICQAVVVVESAAEGGSMITAKFAGEWGRALLAVPGRIDQPFSAGCHALLREGATLCTGVADILEEIGIRPQLELDFGEGPMLTPAAAPPSGPEAALLRLLADGDRIDADSLANDSGLSPGETMATLLRLELNGRIVRGADGRYEKG